MLRIWKAAFYAVTTVAVALSSTNSARAQALILDGEEVANAALYAAAKKEGGLSAYATYSSESMSDALDGFRKDTGLKIDYIRLPTSKLYDRAIAEFVAGKLTADYMDLTDLTLIADWKKRGILAAHKVPSFDKIAPELKDKDGYWIYIVRPVQTIAVNTELVKEADYPKSWADTFDPKWKGKIGMQSIDAGGSAVTLFAFLREKVDPKSWDKIAANDPRTYATMAPAVNDLVRGRVAMAYGGAASFSGQIENNAPLKIIIPTEGIAAFGAFGNVTSVAKNPNAAKVWVNYLTSKRGGGMIARSGSYGTHPESAAPVAAGYTAPPPSQVWSVSPEKWDAIHDTWVDEWKTIFNRK